MSAQITLDWKKDSTFETLMDGHTVTIDTSKEDGRHRFRCPPESLDAGRPGRMQRGQCDLSIQKDANRF